MVSFLMMKPGVSMVFPCECRAGLDPPIRGHEKSSGSRPARRRSSMKSVMSLRHRLAVPIRQHDLDVLHHSLVLVIEDVAMQDELADVTQVARARADHHV